MGSNGLHSDRSPVPPLSSGGLVVFERDLSILFGVNLAPPVFHSLSDLMSRKSNQDSWPATLSSVSETECRSGSAVAATTAVPAYTREGL